MSKRLTTEQFIQRAKAKHGDQYDYSKVVYKSAKTKVLIICPIHGEFLQNPRCHWKAVKGIACPKCSRKHRAKIQSKIFSSTTEEFIKKAKIVHGDKYDYSKVDYNGNKKEVIIICPIHGEFLQKPNSHINKKWPSGCRDCYIEKLSMTQEQFIQKAIEVHGNKYDYSKTKYITSKHEIEIICPNHGEFTQKAANHIYIGSGHPACNNNLVSEPLFREVLEKIFVDKFNKEYKFPNTRPKWLRNPETGWPLELDCYNEELELAFELHGTQHYKPLDVFGGEKGYIKQYRRDLRTRNACWEKGVTLFAIDNRPARNKALSTKREYYEQEILKCLAKVPEKIKVKLLENKVPVQRQSETTIYNT